MAQITEDELNKRLNKNGWMWHLISNATPGIIRIQLADDGEMETNWRKCIEAPTLEQAVADAEAFVESINAYEYGRQQFEAFAQWARERDALAELYDENTALSIMNRRYRISMELAKNFMDLVESEAQMFISEKARGKITKFREQYAILERHRVHSKEIIENHGEAV